VYEEPLVSDADVVVAAGIRVAHRVNDGLARAEPRKLPCLEVRVGALKHGSHR